MDSQNKQITHDDKQKIVSHKEHNSERSSSKSRSSGSKSSSKTSLRRKIKKRKRLIINLSLILAMLIAIAVLLVLAANRNNKNKTPVTETESVNEPSAADDSIVVSMPIFDNEVFLVGDAAVALHNANENVYVPDLIARNSEDGERLDVGLPVGLSFEVESLPTNCTIVSAKVEVSEDRSFFNAKIFELKEDFSVNVSHLKTGTEYHYRITLLLSNGKEASFQSTFQTAATPRILSIDGVRNVRDIGGWETIDGRTIKQGLLYRGTEIDGAVEPDYKISEKGRQDMLTVLGIRTDMDLRSPDDNPSGTDALGANVKHIYYNAPMYGAAFAPNNEDTMRNIFSTLADSDSYPVYLHCTYGTDRTGTVCYLLEALLGLTDDDLVREYELTGLYNPSLDGENTESINKALDAYEGTTTQEKVENYLLSIGITEQEIDSIRSIFLEE